MAVPASKLTPDQVNIFDEAEVEAKPSPQPTIEEITYRRQKRTGQREEKFADLPVEVIEYRLPAEEQVCSCCGGDMHEMSTEERQELKIVPAVHKVVKHVRHIYACRQCEQDNVKTPIKTAPMPAPVLWGSIASPSAIAFFTVVLFWMLFQHGLNAMPHRQRPKDRSVNFIDH